MDSEQEKDFNKRLSQWVAGQGFWFQMRYSMFSGGARGRLLFHLIQMLFRLCLFVLLAALVGWGFLIRHNGSDAFAESVKQGIGEGIAAVDLSVRGVDHSHGRLEIGRLVALGGPSAFYETLQISNLQCEMGVLAGRLGRWDPGVVEISRLVADLRAGADHDEAAAMLGEVLFRTAGNAEVTAIEVADLNLRWGYSARTQGGIEGSSMSARRINDGWRFEFEGGTFRQNWLRGLTIVKIVALCDSTGIHFETAKLTAGDGTVDFSGLRVVGGAKPELVGDVRVQALGLDRILSEQAADFVTGRISGDFKVFGSTNSSDGVGFEGRVVIGDQDQLMLRDQIPLLSALSVMDYSRSYHRLDFNSGAFTVKTSGGRFELRDVDLDASPMFTLSGAMSCRLPNPQEIELAHQDGIYTGPLGFQTGSVLLDDSNSREAGLAHEIQEALGRREVSDSLVKRIEWNEQIRELESQVTEQLSRIRPFQGSFLITIPGDAFERAGELQQTYPVDPITGRIQIEVPIEGRLEGLTENQAAMIFRLGRRL